MPGRFGQRRPFHSPASQTTFGGLSQSQVNPSEDNQFQVNLSQSSRISGLVETREPEIVLRNEEDFTDLSSNFSFKSEESFSFNEQFTLGENNTIHQTVSHNESFGTENNFTVCSSELNQTLSSERIKTQSSKVLLYEETHSFEEELKIAENRSEKGSNIKLRRPSQFGKLSQSSGERIYGSFSSLATEPSIQGPIVHYPNVQEHSVPRIQEPGALGSSQDFAPTQEDPTAPERTKPSSNADISPNKLEHAIRNTFLKFNVSYIKR